MATIKPPNRLTVGIRTGNGASAAAVGERIVVGEIDPYEGDYEVIPKVDESVILPTKDKRMKDNVTVHEVPIFYTRNETGTTVYIGTEVFVNGE